MSRKSPKFNGDHAKALAGILKEIGQRHSRWKVWQDFVAMSALMLVNIADREPKRFAEREAEFVKIAKGYTEDEQGKIAEAFSRVVLGLEERHCDFLGALFMQLELGNDWRGQFFTPYEVSLAMAKMTLADAQKVIDEHGFIEVSDPCVGGGAMVIAAAEALREMGINYQQRLHVVAQDIDLTAFHMAYIQLSLLHIPAVVVLGNSLMVEERMAWPTLAHVMGRWDAKRARRRSLEKIDEVPKVAPAELPTVSPADARAPEAVPA